MTARTGTQVGSGKLPLTLLVGAPFAHLLLVLGHAGCEVVAVGSRFLLARRRSVGAGRSHRLLLLGSSGGGIG